MCQSISRKVERKLETLHGLGSVTSTPMPGPECQHDRGRGINHWHLSAIRYAAGMRACGLYFCFDWHLGTWALTVPVPIPSHPLRNRPFVTIPPPAAPCEGGSQNPEPIRAVTRRFSFGTLTHPSHSLTLLFPSFVLRTVYSI